jgi:GntR family transcriptional regulator, galactonate operon transcriptional repressor
MIGLRTAVIKAERRHEAILRDLIGQIVSGAIPSGSRVPYESETAASYAVSRTVARDAVQRLAGFGLVEVRRRSGAVVTPPERWNMLEPAVLDAAMSGKPSAAFFSALFEARLILEPEAAALAAVRIRAEALDDMSTALAVMRNAPSHEAFVAADLRFHTTILDASSNWVLRQFAGAMKAALLASIRLTRAHSPSLDKSADMHDQVLSAIRAGDVVRSRVAMAWLLTATRLEVESTLQEDTL